jgi:predicted permease
MDLRFAVRSLRKNPGFSLLAVLVMGLGIGANTAVFSVVNSVLLKPLDYREPGRLVTLRTYWKNTGRGLQVSAPDFHDWHDQNTVFSAMAYYNGGEAAVLAGSAAEYGRVASVTPEFLSVFDVRPYLGRFFSGEESQPGATPVVVISYGFWQSHYAGNPNVLGQTLRMFGHSLPIVGVLPPRFGFPDKTDIWYPANTIFSETASRTAHNYLVVARLKPGVPVEQAQSQMTGIAGRLEQEFPADNRNKSVLVALLRDAMVADVRTTLYLLFGAVGVVLLIACANVANLLLAKATGRAREIAIRAAVGAGRGRIVRLLITESLVLAAAAGVVGLVLAWWGSGAIVGLAPSSVPRLAETSIDGVVLAFTFGASLTAALLFGITPALRASRVDLNEALKQGATRAMGGAARLRSGLVVAEIALSVVLLTGAGLLIKSFIALNNVALGFRPENVLVMGTSVQSSDLESAQRATRFYKNFLAQAAAIPGVAAAGATRLPPGRILSNGAYNTDNLDPSIRSAQAVFSIVTPGAFAALGIPVLAGRDFNDRDTYDGTATAIVNESLARRSFPGQNPIGRYVRWGFDKPTPMQIVGVVGDIRQGGPAAEPLPEIYAPYEQHPGASTQMRVIVRTTGEPTARAAALRQKASDVGPDVPVTFTTLEASLAENVAAPRFRTLLFGIFAAVAVCLATAGVYGVMAYLVGRRANEIGLRMALGASPVRVLALVLRQGMGLAAIGLILGLAGAMAATRLLAALLFAVKPIDPPTFAGVVVLIALVSLFATWIPARRAMRLDPLTALRQE